MRDASRLPSARADDGPAVLYETDERVAVVSLNRPRVLNAYDVAMRDALFEALAAVRDDPDIRAVVLRGNGAAFSTGGDLREFGTAPSPVAARAVRWRRDVWGLLRGLPAVTIAAVHGYVVGGGLEMALLCDLCVAGADARFAYPETGAGMIPGVAGTQTTPRAVGSGRALDLLLTGRWVDAEEACRMGIVTTMVAQGDHTRAAMTLARRVCKLAPALVARVKRAVDAACDGPLTGGLALERRLAAMPTA